MLVIFRTIDGKEFTSRFKAHQHESEIKAAAAKEKGFSDAAVVAALHPAVYAQTVAKLENEAAQVESVVVEEASKNG